MFLVFIGYVFGIFYVVGGARAFRRGRSLILCFFLMCYLFLCVFVFIVVFVCVVFVVVVVFVFVIVVVVARFAYCVVNARSFCLNLILCVVECFCSVLILCLSDVFFLCNLCVSVLVFIVFVGVM